MSTVNAVVVKCLPLRGDVQCPSFGLELDPRQLPRTLDDRLVRLRGGLLPG